MRFGTCPSCNEYKYLTEEMGICPTCEEEMETKAKEKALEGYFPYGYIESGR